MNKLAIKLHTIRQALHRFTAVKCYRINAPQRHSATVSPRRRAATPAPHRAHHILLLPTLQHKACQELTIVRSRSFPFVFVRSRSLSIIDQKGIIMRVTIKQVVKDLPAVEALLMQPHTLTINDGRAVVDGYSVEYPDEIDISIICNGIIVRDDLITIEFPNGLIADYEIESDDYHRIIII